MSANNIVINFDKSAPNVIVSPASESSLPLPFTVILVSDEPSTVYYRLDELDPIPGEPGTEVTTTPFQMTISEAGIHNLTFFAMDDVGNVSSTYRYRYYSSGEYSIFGVVPSVGYVQGGTKITVNGDSFNPGATIILGGETLNTSFISPQKLTATTLSLEEGAYPIQVDDPVNGLSIILVNAYTVVEQTEERIEDPVLELGEARRHVFETTEGPMVLTRKNEENYDADNLVELQIKELGVALQIEQNFNEYPENIQVE